MIPEPWRLVYSLNPLAGVIDGFRWALLGDPARVLACARHFVCYGIRFVANGLRYFRTTERQFADVIWRWPWNMSF